MKKPIQSLWLAGALAVSFFTAQVFAQSSQQPPSQQPPSQQQPSQPPGQQSQNPDAQGSSHQGDSQVFTGVIAKVGDRYMLQDSANGTSYDIDQQELAKKYEGQKVRIKGTLDPDGKTIHVK